MSALYAATHPNRSSALIVFGSFPKFTASDDFPWALTKEQHNAAKELFRKRWGEPVGMSQFAPSKANDEQFCRNWAAYLRRSASPAAAAALYEMNMQIDIRSVLDTIRVPTLVIHRTGDRLISVQAGKYMADHIPGAKWVELEGDDHLPWIGDSEAVTGEIQEFLTGMRVPKIADRMLATVVFTDIVGSTERAQELGDSAWRDLLERHNGCVRKELERFRGREVNTAGDGFVATFDGPARAIQCACSIRDAVREIGLEIRAGVHTGECEILGDDIGGIAVHIGARVAGCAGAGEVWVSRTVTDLVAGSGLRFTDRGSHDLKGVEDSWRLYSVES